MRRVSVTLLIIFTCFTVFAQTKKERDSLDMELLSLLKDADKPTSGVDLSLGVGNKTFSIRNNAVNATQGQVNKLYLTPSIAYHHKSGLGVSLTPYLTSDSGSLKVYQTALSPSYTYSNKSIITGISYTRYFADQGYNSNSIYQNDVYLYLKGKNGYVQPTFSMGYSSGNYKEINTITLFSPNRTIRDSTNNHITDFNVSFGLEHSFDAESIFTKNDGISFTPQFLLSAGKEKLTVTHINKSYTNFINKSKRVRSRTQTEKSPFTLQSIALSLDLAYTIGKFIIAPNVYFDYYLPSTTEKRLNTVYSVSFGVSL